MLPASTFRAALLAVAASVAPLQAQDFDLTAMSLEDLMDVEVNLVSRTTGSLFASPAAAYVLNGDDIRRSGATNLADALRLVPGMHVARIDGNKWAVSARGLTGRFAQRLLVLIDGRSVYTPLFSGVFWEVQDVLLEDVERIEVVRGPGATLWGANAVNGVINVVTRRAEQTTGGHMQAGTGSEERALVQARYGGRLGKQGAYRIWAKGFDRDALVDGTGRAADDDWRMGRVGFRADGRRGARDELSLSGQLYAGESGQTYRFATVEPPYRRTVIDDTRLAGAHLLGRWQRTLSDHRDLALQLYYDRTEWEDSLFTEERDTYDLDFQHRLAAGGKELVWGLGWHHTRDTFTGSKPLALDPSARGLSLYSAFAQGGVDLLPDALRLTLGSKFEHNPHTGFEYQPNARLLWTPRSDRALWAAVSRAVRTPSRAEDDMRLELLPVPPGELGPGTPAGLVVVLGNRDLNAERLLAWEVGGRLRPNPQVFFDLAAFYNDYWGIRGGRFDLPQPGPAPPEHLLLPFPVVNGIHGKTYGFELAADGRSSDGRWRLRGHYALLRMDMRIGPGVPSETLPVTEGEHPVHQFLLWGALQPTPAWSLDAVVRFTDDLPSPSQPADAYLGLDLRLAWRPRPGLELAFVGRDLLEARHPEFSAFFVDTLPTETQRSAYAYLSWTFHGE